MDIILASGNKGKLKEFEEYLGSFVTPFKDILGDIEIEENGDSFSQNALIKAREIYNRLDNKNVIVISDDSGISIDALGGKPGIYSARFAGSSASDKENLQKAIDELKALNLEGSKAHYSAAIAIISPLGEYVVHGWMYGDVITTPRGENGFGYDPIFIPQGFDKTLGELGSEIKKEISHRGKALKLAKPIITMLTKAING